MLVLGINDGCDALAAIRRMRYMCVYELTGRLGQATEDGSVYSNVAARVQHSSVAVYCHYYYTYLLSLS